MLRGEEMREAERKAKIKLIKADMKRNMVTPINKLTDCPTFMCEGASPVGVACFGCLESRLNVLMTPKEIKEHDEAWL